MKKFVSIFLAVLLMLGTVPVIAESGEIIITLYDGACKLAGQMA